MSKSNFEHKFFYAQNTFYQYFTIANLFLLFFVHFIICFIKNKHTLFGAYFGSKLCASELYPTKCGN